MVVRGVYKAGSNYYWADRNDSDSFITAGGGTDLLHIELDDRFRIGDLSIKVTTLETTPDYHLIVGGYRLTAGEYYKYRKDHLEDGGNLPFIPVDMGGECTHIRYHQVTGGCLIELYKAYRCNDCNKLF